MIPSHVRRPSSEYCKKCHVKNCQLHPVQQPNRFVPPLLPAPPAFHQELGCLFNEHHLIDHLYGYYHDPEVGDYRDGGVVFYVDIVSRRALVCATRDAGKPCKWGVYGKATGIKRREMFSGGENTWRLAALGGESEAALAASQYQEGGYMDWYLPSFEELQEMYKQRMVINKEALKRGGAKFLAKSVRDDASIYWSSSEWSLSRTQDSDRHLSYGVNFYDGTFSSYSKFCPSSVRSVRDFKF